jgi:hypothetical protein
MATVSLARKLERLETLLRARPDDAALDRLRADPAGLMIVAGMTPDACQQQLLQSDASRLLLLCGRQAGKASITAALALHTAAVALLVIDEAARVPASSGNSTGGKGSLRLISVH